MPSDVTKLLNQMEAGDRKAGKELLPLVYEELRRLAKHKQESERSGQTLQATALVHEAYLRLVGRKRSGKVVGTFSRLRPRRCGEFLWIALVVSAPSGMAESKQSWS